MKFFNGFCFNNEERLFEEFLDSSEYSVAGFSYGCIKALRYILDTDARVDKFQLFSPAFFNDKDKKFTRLQLLHFKKDKDSYIKNFMQNSIYPNDYDISEYLTDGSYEELEDLLTYRWQEDTIKEITKRGISLEVFLSEDDKIVNTTEAKEFFERFATVYMIKNRGHILK
jgi:predicted alpha/beta hydrolase family esterase